MLERILFRKIELWVVLLWTLALASAALIFAASVRYYHSGGERLGRVGPTIDSVAGFPSTAKRAMTTLLWGGRSDLLALEQRFSDEPSGISFTYRKGSRPELGYVLINRYDGDEGRSVAELWDLNAQKLVHVWRFAEVDTLWRRSGLRSVHADPRIDGAARRFRAKHGMLLADGRLLTQDNTPLVSSDICSKMAFVAPGAIYHHSLEKDYDDSIWVPVYMEPKTVDAGTAQFVEDGLVKIDAGGEVRFKRSLAKILLKNGLGYLIYGQGPAQDDPTHLNDIEPVLSDGPHWKKGDVFLSLRNRSMILLYRPSTDKVLWFKQGPWLHQHDVNVLDEYRISIFNNNAALKNKTSWVVLGSNDVMVYDFRTGEVASPWKAAFDAHQIRTRDQGRGTVVGEEVFVEETNFGRLIQVDRAGVVSWRYINRARDGNIYLLSWSRLVPRALGDRIRTLVASGGCG